MKAHFLTESKNSTIKEVHSTSSIELFTKIIDNSIEMINNTKKANFCFKIMLLILFSYINFYIINNILSNELNNISNQTIHFSISNKYICKYIIIIILFIIVTMIK